MTTLLKVLQNPLLKIFLSPISVIAIGAITGLNNTNSPKWLSIVYLALIAISSQLIDHFFHQKQIRRNPNATPELILFISEVVLIGAGILFALSNHWILNVLLAFYLLYIHIQYKPFVMVNTFYQFILTVFFNGFVLNCVAYYSQTATITTKYITLLVPFVLLVIGITIESMHLKYSFIRRKPQPVLYHWTAIALAFAALPIAFYLALPSKSYYLVQLVFVVFNGFIMLPLLVSVNNEKRLQNKLNYLNAVLLLFSLFYALALVF
ncbi:hypothetical protein I4Q36_02215 [Tuanshanicoccus lijuaniae]|uniref:hypothetical protein n=1 Tax=Aerococcaceae bacterium zg-1292 TaxID=2774330 RepID=UPI001937B57D|nr:hypothetical protein [Aerococcaceae bacterium zg-1292]QQA37553.1 hypothetical protein I4Q36_02215 [Aerococcaceae bacterium zg-1292]